MGGAFEVGCCATGPGCLRVSGLFVVYMHVCNIVVHYTWICVVLL